MFSDSFKKIATISALVVFTMMALSHSGMYFLGDSRSRTDLWWARLHGDFVKEIERSDALRGYEVIFYGDSITESWRGTSKGEECSRCMGIPEVFSDTFIAKYKTTALGISGDQTSHLLYRLQHGEIPVTHLPKVVVVHIGTNDLGYAAALTRAVDGPDVEQEVIAAVPAAARKTLEIVTLLKQKLPDTQIVLMGVLPRADITTGFQQPNIYSTAITELNMHLSEYASQDGQVHYIDCGSDFYAADGSLEAKFMPDGLHPNEQGAVVLGYCLGDVVDSLMADLN